MAEEKTVVVLLAAYNGERFISAQIDSILNQSYRNVLLIVSDDASSDGTADIVKNYCTRYSNICLIHNNDNGSPRKNFNNLIFYALKNFTDEYVMFSDQDDVWFENKIELEYKKMSEIKKKLEKDTPCMIYTNYYVEYSNSADRMIAYGYPINKTTFSRVIMQSWPMGCTMMVDMNMLKFAGPCPKEANNHDEWISQVAALIGHIEYMHAPTLRHIIHENNATTRLSTDNFVNRIVRTVDRLKKHREFIEEKEQVLQKLRNQIFGYEEAERQLNYFEKLLHSSGLETIFLMKQYGFYGVNRMQNVLFYLQFCRKKKK